MTVDFSQTLIAKLSSSIKQLKPSKSESPEHKAGYLTAIKEVVKDLEEIRESLLESHRILKEYNIKS